MCRIFSRRRRPLASKFVLLLELDFPELSILQKNVNGGCHCDIETGETFTESAFEDIGPKEPNRRPQQSIAHPKLAPFFVEFVRGNTRKPIDTRHVIVDVAI